MVKEGPNFEVGSIGLQILNKLVTSGVSWQVVRKRKQRKLAKLFGQMEV